MNLDIYFLDQSFEVEVGYEAEEQTTREHPGCPEQIDLEKVWVKSEESYVELSLEMIDLLGEEFKQVVREAVWKKLQSQADARDEARAYA